jgi:hypothetical protein
MTFEEFKNKYADHIQGKAQLSKGGRKRKVEDDNEVQNTSQNDVSEGEGDEEEEDGKDKPTTPDAAAKLEALQEGTAHLTVP